MGMDVYGLKPTAQVGNYFRRSVWGWGPLADFVNFMHPGITSGCQYWHTNDSDGLNANDSRQLATALKSDVEHGRAKAYAERRDAMLADMPNEPCSCCNSTGIRRDKVGLDMKQPTKRIPEDGLDECGTAPHPRAGKIGWCNCCDGRGHSRPFATHYFLGAEDISEFADFLGACGGFEIC